MQVAPIFDQLAADHGLEQLLLTAEVAVNRFFGDTGAAGHRVDARAAIAVLEEILRCNVEHLLLFGLRLEPAFVENTHEARHAARAGATGLTTAHSFLAIGID